MLWLLVVIIVLGISIFTGGGTAAQIGSAAAEVSDSEAIPGIWYLAPVGSILALVFAFIFYRGMKKESEGTDEMKAIAQGVREGANAYLRRQYKVVAIFLVILAAILAYLAFGMAVPVMNPWVPFAFLTGGFFSALCGWLGMKTATYANSRTTNAARKSLDSALKVAFRSGAVMGFVGYTPRPQMSVPTWWAKWKPESPKTTREILQYSPTMLATMLAT